MCERARARNAHGDDDDDDDIGGDDDDVDVVVADYDGCCWGGRGGRGWLNMADECVNKLLVGGRRKTDDDVGG